MSLIRGKYRIESNKQVTYLGLIFMIIYSLFAQGCHTKRTFLFQNGDDIEYLYRIVYPIVEYENVIQKFKNEPKQYIDSALTNSFFERASIDTVKQKISKYYEKLVEGLGSGDLSCPTSGFSKQYYGELKGITSLVEKCKYILYFKNFSFSNNSLYGIDLSKITVEDFLANYIFTTNYRIILYRNKNYDSDFKKMDSILGIVLVIEGTHDFSNSESKNALKESYQYLSNLTIDFYRNLLLQPEQIRSDPKIYDRLEILMSKCGADFEKNLLFYLSNKIESELVSSNWRPSLNIQNGVGDIDINGPKSLNDYHFDNDIIHLIGYLRSSSFVDSAINVSYSLKKIKTLSSKNYRIENLFKDVSDTLTSAIEYRLMHNKFDESATIENGRRFARTINTIYDSINNARPSQQDILKGIENVEKRAELERRKLEIEAAKERIKMLSGKN